ncbi:MAG: ATP-dependent helicase [Candidatus Pacebacteria bacterium]|nr:ATP-dependent helicase [Candidatus Paceibacterota bacterium]
MSDAPTFNTLYKKLNAEQKKAVDAIEGPVMVVAGPGTGKTQILTLRIANILKQTDADPSSILALTFTEAGVAAMRKRLVSMIGADGYRVGIHTFHGFCNAMIGRYPDDFPRLVSSQAITDIDKILLLHEILESTEGLKEIRPFYDPVAYTRDIVGAISTLKREYLTPEEFKDRVEEEEKVFWAQDDLYNEKGTYKGKMKTMHQRAQKRIERNKELARVFETYEAALRERKLYDYEDMISVVVRRLEENRDVLQRLQEEFHYLLADEHQDANDAQNRLLELLADFHDNPNLFIVGDEKQAIFRFQGASLENFLYFKKKYPEALLVELKDSYRSGQVILDASHSLMEGTPGQEARTPLVSCAGVIGATVELRVFSADQYEAAWVAREAARLVGEGVPAEEIAILYRTNADAAVFAQALEREAVPHTVESNRNVLDDPAIAQFVMLLRATAHYGSDEYLARVLHARFLGFAPIDVYRALKYASRERMLLHDLLLNEEKLKDAKVADPKKMSVFAKRLAKWAEAGSNDPVPDVFNRILDESGFLTHALNTTRSVEMIEKLSGLARSTEMLALGERSYTLGDLVRHFDLLDEYRISIQKTGGARAGHGVRLMTAHRSKGLEFEQVFLVGAWDTHWGNKRKMDKFSLPLRGADDEGDNDDERRLFYVALTRAKARVAISYASSALSGSERLPSIFLEEMDEKAVVSESIREFEEALPPETFLVASPEQDGFSIADGEYLRELFIEQGLSVTALNNYLACPWRYFYSNLIRIPKIPTKDMILGTVVHQALRAFFDALGKGKVKKDVLLQTFRDALLHTTLSGRTYDDVLKKGEEALSGWFDAHDSWSKETLNEYRIETTLPLSIEGLSELRLRGDIDKMEICDDGVRVIDYKTGKPKSRNEMMGKTKARGAGDYFRQLVFYRLLLDLEGRYTMKDGAIDFIQPKPNGTYTSEVFSVEEDDVAVLRDEIARVSQEILTLSFWDTRCEAHKKGECEYCALRDLMQ